MKKAVNPFADVREKAEKIVSEMTVEEKASLCSGKDFWTTKAVERAGVKSFMVTDGPHGLRKQAGDSDHLGINVSVPATCFPTAAATSCCFDRELMTEMGKTIGEECIAEDVAVILGPAVNIKRSPLCGRNFEYFSEDPLLAGETAAALIEGIQSENVGTSLKHYLANNQEKARLVSDSIIDERALREIYLAGFETAIKKSQPWTLMCSYNKINGTYASDNKRLMTDVPRGEWGYEGAIMTDWGAMNDRVKAVEAGLDLEMPGTGDWNDKLIVEAVKNGSLSEEYLDKCAVRMVSIALKAEQNKKTEYDISAHNELARKIARESAVLLKKGEALPLKKDKKIAVIGEFAKIPRYQGAGSSKINPHKVTSLCDALDERNIEYAYSSGYHNEETDKNDELIAEAVKTAENADVIIVCAGLPDSYESEGFDRAHLDMPESHNALIDALIKTGKKIAVVLSTGASVIMPWRNEVDSILLMYLGGQNVGSAAADLLLGEAVPCGRLGETWPLALEDNPSFTHFGNGGNIEYRESIYCGYRYYDKAKKQVQYPFGFGLSYTDFEYSNLKLSKTEITDTEELTVTVTVKNTGDYAAKEIVQLYAAPPESAAFKPVRELRNFGTVYLEPGESKDVTLTLDRRAFAYYNVNVNDWFVESGVYKIEIGKSSRDIVLSADVKVNSAQDGKIPDYREVAPEYYNLSSEPYDVPLEQFEAVLGRTVEPWHAIRPFTKNSTLGEIKTCEVGKNIYDQFAAGMAAAMGDSGDIAVMLQAMLDDMPLRQLAMIGGDNFSPDKIDGLLAIMNA